MGKSETSFQHFTIVSDQNCMTDFWEFNIDWMPGQGITGTVEIRTKVKGDLMVFKADLTNELEMSLEHEPLSRMRALGMQSQRG